LTTRMGMDNSGTGKKVRASLIVDVLALFLVAAIFLLLNGSACQCFKASP
jgi:hypothetical protein